MSEKETAYAEAEHAKELFAKGEISKNALKKKLRLARAVQSWQDKAERKREESKKKEEERAKRKRDFLSSLTEGERHAWEQSMRERRSRIRKEVVLKRKEIKETVMSSPYRLVIDLAFEDLMNDREVKSITQQIMYSVSTNTKAKSPFNLELAGLDYAPKIVERLSKIDGSDTWLITRQQNTIDKVFDKDRLVYLSADAEHDLETLSVDDILIIGGIVDHNRFKDLTICKAKELGIRTMRLPLDKYLPTGMREVPKVLTVNHMVMLLCAKLAGCSWNEAIMQSIPQRKATSVAKKRQHK